MKIGMIKLFIAGWFLRSAFAASGTHAVWWAIALTLLAVANATAGVVTIYWRALVVRR